MIDTIDNKPILSDLANVDEILDFGEDFNFDDFQVVRREFFAHLREPSASFCDCKFYVNSACISKFSNFLYAQVLINKEKKILALRPCTEYAKDCFMWANYNKKGKLQPKAITARLFFAKIVSLMGWNPSYRYKLLGRIIHSKDEYMLAFDLTAAEVYQRTIQDGKTGKFSRKPVFPADWQDQFGLPYNEHKQQMEVSVFDGYAVYSLKDLEQPGKQSPFSRSEG